jgi:DNA-binding PadR family transcriptional regulator
MHTEYVSVRNGLLALLLRAPAHGYQLRAQFEAVTGRAWPLNVGQVYTTLARLERNGHVEVVAVDADGRISYALTPDGESAVARWFTEPVQPRVDARDELAIKVALATSIADVDVEEILSRQRQASLAVLQDLTRLKAADADEADLGWRLVLEGLRLQVDAELRWLDYCDEMLAGSRSAADPPIAARSADVDESGGGTDV